MSGDTARQEMKALGRAVPMVKSFLTATFHQDWRDEWENVEDGYRSDLDAETGARREALQREADTLSAHLLTDSDVREFLVFIGATGGHYRDLGMTPLAWLGWFKRRVDADPDTRSTDDRPDR